MAYGSPGNFSGEGQPSYAGLFRCIGPECEDTCCAGWDIPVDKVTFEAYRRFPAEKLGALVARHVAASPGAQHDALYASIHRKEDGSCPFLGADRLCGIQKEHGARLLSSTCSTYPRSLAVVHGRVEGSLSLSCPEAARNILLAEGSTERAADLLAGDFRTDNVFEVRPRPGLESWLLPIRRLLASLICDRSRPVWQRLVLIASFCSQLDAVAGVQTASPERLIGEYETTLGLGASVELDRLLPRVATRLELVIALSNQRCRDRDCGRRFHSLFWDFVEGIGSSDGEGPEADVVRFQQASRNHLEPFLERLPFLLENYLLNYLYQHVFPFGLVGSDRFFERSMQDEAVLLVAQFSWLLTLLTGVAGKYGQEFSEAHLITAVQAFTRAVEHVPRVREDALLFVKGRGLGTLTGLCELLRA